jgi:hypothetical protein
LEKILKSLDPFSWFFIEVGDDISGLPLFGELSIALPTIVPDASLHDPVHQTLHDIGQPFQRPLELLGVLTDDIEHPGQDRSL